MKRNSLKKIAVTGGIGSGKSTVCKMIEAAGYPVISFDGVYGELLTSGTLTGELRASFGDDIITATGEVDRKALARKAFSSAENIEKLNKITHPAIFKAAFKKAERYGGVCFFEVPLLFEGNYQGLFDGVIVVMRDLSRRIEDVTHRDGISREEVKDRIKRQYNYNNGGFEEYYVIHNDGTIDNLLSKVAKVLSDVANG